MYTYAHMYILAFLLKRTRSNTIPVASQLPKYWFLNINTILVASWPLDYIKSKYHSQLKETRLPDKMADSRAGAEEIQ